MREIHGLPNRDSMEEFKLLLDLNLVLTNTLTENIIKEMMLCRETMSGDDSGLRNLWEEICVQVQGEESFYWEVYSDTIDVYIQAELDKQPMAIKRLFSYVEQIVKEDNEEALVYSEAAAVMAVRATVLQKAEEYQNRNILSYLDLLDEDEEEEEEEGDNDEEDDEEECGETE